MRVRAYKSIHLLTLAYKEHPFQLVIQLNAAGLPLVFRSLLDQRLLQFKANWWNYINSTGFLNAASGGNQHY